MNSAIFLLIIFGGYFLAWKIYGKFLGAKIFELSQKKIMPAEKFRDEIDFVPTRAHVVFGHHFVTISGLGPIVGPAIGIIWGWLPAVLWIFFGSIFLGAVHDLAAIVISARHDGKSIGEITEKLIGRRAKFIFQILIQFLLTIVVAIFAMIIATLFKIYPHSVVPVWAEIPIAIWLGHKIKNGKKDFWYSIFALIFLYATIFLGKFFPIFLPPIFGSEIIFWVLILFFYVFFASTISVQKLLQPRDYINSHQLFLIVGILIFGIFFAHPEISAPAINFSANLDAPKFFPFIFITIACGAISGFHSLAASGTTIKQLRREPDALPIGFGGMLLEGAIAIIVILAIAAGLGIGAENGREIFFEHYSSWSAASTLGAKLNAFIFGAANILREIGIPLEWGKILIAVFIVSFASTTLDSAVRIQRLGLQEIFRKKNGEIFLFQNRFFATAAVIFLAAALIFSQSGAAGALILWPIFGALNQLLAALGLFLATIFLFKNKKNFYFTFFPAIFMFFVTIWAMLLNLGNFVQQRNFLLIFLSLAIFAIAFFIFWDATKNFFFRHKKKSLALFLIFIFSIFFSATNFVLKNSHQKFFGTADCAVIFGARPNSAALRDRVAAAQNLFLQKKVARIIFSGDKIETKNMKNLAPKIPPAKIFTDENGKNTLATLQNLPADCANFVFVSNDFHLARIKLLAKKIGLKKFSLHAAEYRDGKYFKNSYFFGREILATIFYFFAH